MHVPDDVFVFVVVVVPARPRSVVAVRADMWDQTLSVFSVGKTFSCTGWRVGYAVGPEHLITPLKIIGVRVFACRASTPIGVC